MRRIVVVGSSGSGKTTLAGALATRLGLTHIELDALFHQEGWTQTPVEEFQTNLGQALDRADDAASGWTVCGNYNDSTNDIHLDRADTVVWLDLPRLTVMKQLIRRTVRRAITREELWNGNREPLRNFYRWDPEHNVIRWSWVEHHRYQAEYEAKLNDGSWRHLQIYRLRSSAEIDAFLAMAMAAAG